MAIILKLKNKTPNQIIESINSLIDNGSIRVWEIDLEGDYTHSSTQWNKRGWFRSYLPKEDDEWSLKFGIIGNKHEEMTRALYGIYHGRFAEMLLTYFDSDIEELQITPNKDSSDSF